MQRYSLQERRVFLKQARVSIRRGRAAAESIAPTYGRLPPWPKIPRPPRMPLPVYEKLPEGFVYVVHLPKLREFDGIAKVGSRVDMNAARSQYYYAIPFRLHEFRFNDRILSNRVAVERRAQAILAETHRLVVPGKKEWFYCTVEQAWAAVKQAIEEVA